MEGRKHNGSRRDARAQAAGRHTAEMERRFASEIEASAAGVRQLDAAPPLPEGAEGCVPAVSVVPESATAIILARGRGRAAFCDMAVLDCASFTRPGGGYERGGWGQEEALCADSFLYNVLSQHKAWYGENRRRNINCELYRNRALVVPAVRFAREKVHAYADVIVAAAPHAERARSEYHIAEDVLVRSLRDRIRFILAIADALGHDKLVLGAFGCDFARWDPAQVAEAFREELAGGAHVAREVIFAIPQVRFNDHFERFSHALATFPERNGESFEQARAAAEAVRAAAEAAEQEEEEDDWRRYL